ncbi:MAG: quinone-dependent dihydroorotate dehydrogenase [Bacteroidetes bacterium]|nr:quinone-dependent dihydroorotate dehydrogenase [Bacteroidota bacterium]MBS1740083.1 quinone-dependent dihydroorotate dehydrogenase [Bacteroidota bacterium]MBS1774722.1 quinone-dependent dihydroorotate dehydrogenase [Bacteroidota bacterium]
MYSILRKLLFTIQPERVHHLIMHKLNILYKFGFTRSILKKLFSVNAPALEKEVFGIKFPNPVGLAAGFDKDAKYTDALACLGFGFLEIGTVTPRPQPGNPSPRLFRLPQDQALINRMGFNNDGATASANRLKKRRETLIIGGNIGKNKDTPNEQAIQDYEAAFRALYEVVDYFVVNVSSPNTPGLRALQDKEPLMALLNHLQKINQSLGNQKPILLKIAPDLTNEQLEDIVQIVAETAIAGIVATNTTINRENLNTPKQEIELIGAGGLSGVPVRERSTEVIRFLHSHSKGAFPIIAVGGIFTAKDALEKLNAGASLVQVYTGFIYEGPSIVKNICKGLASSIQ